MRYAILVFILPWICFASAQLNGKYSFRHIDQADGLLYTSIRNIAQDSRGFVWILSQNGLQRYDGSRFVDYPEITNHSSFGIMHDSELFVDNVHDEVWVAKGTTADRLNLVNNRIENLSLADILNHVDSAEIYTAENGDTWLIGEAGVMQHLPDKSKISGYYFNVNPKQKNRHSMLFRESSGDFWLHNFIHLFKTDHVTKKIYSTSDKELTHPLLKQLWDYYGNTNRIRFIMKDGLQHIWITTWTEKLHRYDPVTKILHTYSLKELKRKHGFENSDLTLLVNAVYEDRQHNLWMGTDYAGLMLYDRDKDDFNFITSDDKISNGLRYNFSITSIFQDKDDNIWLGTDRGISIFNPYRNYIQSIRHIDGIDASLPKFDILDFVQTNDGLILIGMWGGGISMYDKHLNFIRNIHFPGPPEYNLVWSFIKHEDGLIWAGTQGGHIHIFDPLKNMFETIRPPEANHSTITAMAADKQGNILMGMHNGKICVWKKDEKTFYSYNNEESYISIPYLSVINIFIDQADRCWVTTASGLQEFDTEKRLYTNLYRPEGFNDTTGISVQGIAQYNDSLLVLGTIYEGIYFFNTETKKFSRPPLDNELARTSVFAVKTDQDKNIWHTTNFSLHKINQDFSLQTQFNIDHNLMNAAFGSPKFYELNDGRWASSTYAEIIFFNPAGMGIVADSNLSVAISGFKVFNEDLYIDSFLVAKNPIILPYNKNFITIEFSVLDYFEQRVANYYYRLSGVDQDWVHTTTKEFADYTDLKPGEYTFEVKADKGGNSSPVLSFPLIITPPWWGTWWFRLACILAVIAFGYFLLKKRIQMIRKESELKQKMAATEMMALRAQMNPHFIFNCLSSIDSLIQTNQKEEATTYLAKFALLIRTILENSKSNVIPCWKDMEALKLYLDLEALRWGNKIDCQMHIDPQIQEGDYKVPPMIIQPFVENSIHHGLLNKLGPDRKLEISVNLDGDRLKYTITDNGVGRMKAAEYKKLNHGSRLPFGIQITEDRINLFNRGQSQSVKITDLYNSAQVPAGTKVEVWLHMQSNGI